MASHGFAGDRRRRTSLDGSRLPRSPSPYVLCIALTGLLCLADNCYQNSGLPRGFMLATGPVNGVSIERDGHRVVFYGDPDDKLQDVEKLFLTHHRRDVAWAALPLADKGVRVVAPAAELPFFNVAEGFWQEFRGTRFHNYAQQSTKILTKNLTVQEPAVSRSPIDWRGLTIEVLDTPGYTRGAVSYIVELGGRRIALTGDLILAGGRILDLYSLQDSIEETETRGYHGYAARAADVLKSLRRIVAVDPDIVVPVRGPVIRDVQGDIAILQDRIQRLFRAYFRTDALRWYWGEANL